MSPKNYRPRCMRIGCDEPVYTGDFDGFCSRNCRILIHCFLPAGVQCPVLDVAFFPDPRFLGGRQKLAIVAFYFPGHEEVWDEMCRASFLGNFYHMGAYRLELCPPSSGKRVFTNAEAAFQALKFWHKAGEFEDLSGSGAFSKKQRLAGTEDRTYAGFRSNWKAMRAVITAKFKEGPWVQALQRTGESFLLEHNSRKGRDSIWSDDEDGAGKNWLGLQLMLLRDELSGGCKSSWTRFISNLVDIETGEPWNHNNGVQWQDIVKSAATALSDAVEEERRRRWLRQLTRWVDTEGILSPVIEDLPQGSDITQAFVPRACPLMNATLALCPGEITGACVDAIVNPASSDWGPHGNVSYAIHRAAGPELFVECNQLPPCADCKPTLTKGYKLPAKHVIHIAGLWDPNRVFDGYMDGLRLAVKQGLKSIALCCKPSCDYSCIEGTHMTLKFLRAWLESNPGLLDCVLLVAPEQAECEVCRRLLPYYFPRAGDLEFRLVQDQMVDVLFKWSGPGTDVFLAGDFNHWQRHRMDETDDGMFIKAERLHQGIHRYRFFVDGVWSCCEGQPKQRKYMGGWYNIIDLGGCPC